MRSQWCLRCQLSKFNDKLKDDHRQVLGIQIHLTVMKYQRNGHLMFQSPVIYNGQFVILSWIWCPGKEFLGGSLKNEFRVSNVLRTIIFSFRSSRALSPPPSHGHGHGGYLPEESSHLSYEMRTRLKTLPDSNVSMGMFSNPYAKTLSPPKNSGYRIVVSNLHSSVSQSDIKVNLISTHSEI